MKPKNKRGGPRPAQRFVPQYSAMNLLMSSSVAPLEAEYRKLLLGTMWAGLIAIESAEAPTRNDWRVCTDCVNLLATIIEDGVAEDADGLLTDAINALAAAGRRHNDGGALRLDGPGIKAVRGILDDFEACVNGLSARYMKDVSNRTDRTIWHAQHGRAQRPGVQVVSL